MTAELHPRFPLYIVSKGRHEYMITSRSLTKMGVPHFIVVEPQQVADYEAAVRRFGTLTTVLPLDMSFKDRYELCDDLGLTKSTGSGPARNFAWEHSRSSGHPWHWVMDDNIKSFRRYNLNNKRPCVSPAFWRAMEDFVLRYKNIAMAGPQYYRFVPSRMLWPPFITNTRLYSCNLIRNDVPFRWRGRYNEDTILSLDMLKAGWCTIQFNAFLQEKMDTQLLPGGNSVELYGADTRKQGEKYASGAGATAKSEMLVRVHPDVARVTWRFGRVHHTVNYRRFKRNRLVLRADAQIPEVADNYGMSLRPTGNPRARRKGSTIHGKAA